MAIDSGSAILLNLKGIVLDFVTQVLLETMVQLSDFSFVFFSLRTQERRLICLNKNFVEMSFYIQ